MNLDTFFTMQAMTPAAQKAATGKATSAPGHVQGLGFIDMILAQMLEKTQQEVGTPTSGEGHNPLQSENPLLDKNPELNLAELLAANPEVKKEVENFITAPGSCLTPEQQLKQTLALNQQALDKTLKPLTDGIITSENVANGSPRLMQALLVDTEKDRKGVLNNLQMILNKLEQFSKDKTGAGLTLTNLTPGQITNLQEKLQALLAKGEVAASVEDDKEIANILIGLVKLLPPQAQPEVIIMPHGLVVSPQTLAQKNSTSTDKAVAANDLTGKLNDLISGEDVSEDFKNLVKQAGGKKDASVDLQLGQAAAKSTPAVKADLSALLNWQFAVDDGSMFIPYDSLDSYSGLSSLNVTSPAGLTNLVTNAPAAGMSHPATQMVAVQLQKMASDAQNKSFNLQLDPPELGRIEVRLNFAKDKTVKALVMTERSETLSMLQRDSHFLERALQATGLEMDGGISFELADDGHFSQDGGHDGSRNNAKNSQVNEPEIIESTMSWYVDAATGRQRYDLLA